VDSITFAPDGRHVLLGMDTGEARMIPIEGKGRGKVVTKQGFLVRTLAFDAKGTSVATATPDEIRVVKLDGSAPVRKLAAPEYDPADLHVFFSRDPQRLFFHAGTALFAIDAANRDAKFQRCGSEVHVSAPTLGGAAIVTIEGASEAPMLRILDPATLKPRAEHRIAPFALRGGFAVSADGRIAAFATFIDGAAPAGAGQVRVYELATGRCLRVWATETPMYLALSPKGDQLAAERAKTVRIYDLGKDAATALPPGAPDGK
jgi:hypothetical protein